MNGTDFILFYEKYALYRLAERIGIEPKEIRHLSAELPTSPYDLEYKGIRYDVKISSPVMVNKGKITVWDFNTRKGMGGKKHRPNDGKYCDYLILVGMLRGIPAKVYLMPLTDAPKNHVRVSIYGTSKYHKYEI